jgi:hypothetical protein
MTRNALVGLALCACVVAAVFSRWTAHANATQPPQTNIQMDPWRELDAKAFSATRGEESNVRELTRQVFKPFHWRTDDVRGHVEERLARAELAFRSGQHRALSEESIVSTVNNLAGRIGAPEYAENRPHAGASNGRSPVPVTVQSFPHGAFLLSARCRSAEYSATEAQRRASWSLSRSRATRALCLLPLG